MANIVNVGVCTGTWDSTARSRCNDLKVSHIRIDGGVQWHNVETSQSNYNWSTIDTVISQNVSDGRKVTWILDYNNPVYGATLNSGFYGTGLINTTMRNGYSNYCVAVVNHLNSQGWLDDVVLELWNEPDISIYWTNADGSERDLATRANEYEATINQAVQAMKAAQPNCQILAFSSNWPTGYTTYANNACDGVTVWGDLYAVGFHPYLQGSAFNSVPESTSGGTIYEHFHNSFNNMDNHGMPGDIRPWISELGYNTAGGSEVNQTDAHMLQGYLPRLILNAMLWGVYDFTAFSLSGTTWYGIYDQGTQPDRRNLFEDLCDNLNGAEHIDTPINSGGNYVLKFTKDGDTIYAYWTTGSSNQQTVDGHQLTLQTVPQYYVDEASGIPAAPEITNITVTSTGTNTFDVDITWTDNATDETGYKVYISTDGLNYTLLDTIAANSTSYNDSITGTEGSTVWLRVVAYNGNGEGSDTETTILPYSTTPDPLGTQKLRIENIDIDITSTEVNNNIVYSIGVSFDATPREE